MMKEQKYFDKLQGPTESAVRLFA